MSMAIEAATSGLDGIGYYFFVRFVLFTFLVA